MSEPVPGDVICVRSGLPDATIAGLELSLTEGDRGRGVAQSLGGEELTAPDIRAYERFYASVEDDIFHEPR